MGAALVLLLVGLGAMAAGVLIGRYYVPDDRQLRRTARHGRHYMRALGHLIARDHDTVVRELRHVVEENIDDPEPYFALGAMFRSRGEHERAIRVHQALAVRERERKKLRQRAMYELGVDFRAAGMPRRATRAMEEVVVDDPSHEGALRSLAALYEEQARFFEAAELWARLGRRRNEDLSEREHHLYVAAAQAALARGEPDAAKDLLRTAQRLTTSAHFFAAAAQLAAARGNHRGARERLRQALVAEPALVPELLPALIAAEEGLGAPTGVAAIELPTTHDDELAEPEPVAADEPAAPAASQDAVPETLPETPATPTPPPPSAEPAARTRGLPPPPPPAAIPRAPGLTTGAIAPVTAPPTETATALAAISLPLPASLQVAAGTQPLVPELPALSVGERVSALLLDVERTTGPRIELALIRAQLAGPERAVAIARELAAQFPDALSTRVAVGRLALASRDATAIRSALEGLASDRGVLAWALHGRWQCAHCRHRPTDFSWRCGQCRRWGSLAMETGVEPPPLPSRERRAQPRVARPDVLLGTAPDRALPAATLDADGLAPIRAKRSLLGRVGGWFGGAWRRGA